MQLVVHLGLHKTGSSAIQDSLASGLGDPGWCYLALGRPNGSLAVRQAFDETFAPGPRRPFVRQRGRRTIAEAFARATAQRAILSAESLSALSPSDLRAAYATFASHADPITAIGYLRPTKSYFESAFPEMLKTRLPGPAAFTFDYRATIERIDATFGRDRVTLLKYQRAALHNGCAVQDLCNRLGIAFDPSSVIDSNVSLSREAVGLLYIYRLLNPRPGEGDQRIVAALAGLPGDRFAFHSRLFAKLSRVGAADIDAVSERLGESFADDLTAEDATGIHALDDLLKPSAATLDWLAARSGVAVGDLAGRGTAIAAAVGSLDALA